MDLSWCAHVRYSLLVPPVTRRKCQDRAAEVEPGHVASFANGADRRESGYSREVVLLICLALLAVMFIVTGVVARAYHKRVHTLADQWFAQGAQAYQSGDSATAA